MFGSGHEPTDALTWAKRWLRLKEFLLGLSPKGRVRSGRLLPLRGIGFRARVPRFPSLIPLHELNSRAIRISRLPGLEALNVGSPIEGEIAFERKTVKLSGSVSHVTAFSLEVTLDEAPGFENAIRQYFQDEPDAQNWVETSPDILQEDPSGEAHQLKHRDGRELYLVLEPKTGHVLHFSFSDGSLYITAERGKSSHWGAAEEAPVREKLAHASSTLVNRTARPPQAFMAKMSASVLSVPHLSFRQRNEMGEMLMAGQPKWKASE